MCFFVWFIEQVGWIHPHTIKTRFFFVLFIPVNRIYHLNFRLNSTTPELLVIRELPDL